MSSDQYVIGLDFGTDSVRAVLVNALDGKEISNDVHWYQRWKQGMYCNPVENQYRQHPQDHIEGIQATIKEVMKTTKISPERVKAICIDTTGSSPIALDQSGRPLCFTEGLEKNPHAMVILWKDHTAIAEAEEINALARSWGGVDFTKYEGGIYSSEWFWAKILHTIRADGQVKESAYTWMEHCDLMTYLLVGSPELSTFKRSRCAAGHKAMWHERWGGLPADEFLSQLDPSLPTLKEHLYRDTYTSDQAAGTLSEKWADRLGLTTDTVVAVGTFDAHAGAVGAEVEENTLVRIMGTSTCDIIVAPEAIIGDRTVRGICGQVDGSVIPGLIGLEAGQSAFGDLLAWFRDVICWPIDELQRTHPDLVDTEIQDIKDNVIARLSQQAELIPISKDMPVALDWINGRRTPDADQSLKSAIVNLSLGTKAPEIFKSLVESICFGSRMIIERFREEGVEIGSVVGIGGVAKKSSYIMQTLADVLHMPIKIARSEQAPALGAAMYAATAAGIYSDIQSAIEGMGSGFEKTYYPREDVSQQYEKAFETYEKLGAFISNEIK